MVCDRFFDSTYAYQAVARGISGNVVQTANELGCCGVVPDATLVFDISPQEALLRATSQGADRLESEGTLFQERVREGYAELAKRYPERIRIIDASGTKEVVRARMLGALRELLS